VKPSSDIATMFEQGLYLQQLARAPRLACEGLPSEGEVRMFPGLGAQIGNCVPHRRHTGWKISLDRGLDIFQKFEMNDTFNRANGCRDSGK